MTGTEKLSEANTIDAAVLHDYDVVVDVKMIDFRNCHEGSGSKG